MLLAAGRGQRMGALTRHTPKPLLTVAGAPLIVHQVRALTRAGCTRIVVNVAHLGARIEALLGDGVALGARVVYSREPPGARGTGGGIFQALGLLGPAPFIVANADVYTDFDYATLPADPPGLAHLVLVRNPAHRRDGDFALDASGRIANHCAMRHTFAGIGVYRPELFVGCAPGVFSVIPLLRAAADRGEVTGALHTGRWHDVGTPARLRAARAAA
jgi:N-acetyl-alpha-D-muramate 1-phosphate uridylyltransferase